MRTVAAYSLTHAASDSTQASESLVSSCGMVEKWLGDKGATALNVGQHKFPLPDGRSAALTRERMETDDGILDSFVLNEPISGGRFETRLNLACANAEMVLFCQLATGSAESALAPVQFDARCPRVLRDIIQSGGWTSGSTPVSHRHWTRIGREAGRALADTIWDDERGLPVVVVSELDGFMLHPELANDVARDLTGLATVVHIDEEAAWLLSEDKGREWSCYQGALRLYWPFQTTRNDPYSHPLWTRGWLLHGGMDTTTAAKRLQNRLRRTILEQSAFRSTPPLISQIRDRYISGQRKKARDAGEYATLADDFDKENRRLKQELDERIGEIWTLRQQIEDLNVEKKELTRGRDWVRDSRSTSDEEPVESPSAELETVEDAVLGAMDDCEHLIFGDDVTSGIDGLAQDAGPPMKILRYLRALETMTAQLKEGPLGDAIHQWLKRNENIEVSGESETVRNSPARMANRTWDDGSGHAREFQRHLKPSDSTSPDRCVRIYFDYDKELGKTIVGWVGRHPD